MNKDLTQREVELLRLLRQGYQLGPATRMLGVVERTGQRILTRARHKLGARTVIQAVANAVAEGCI